MNIEILFLLTTSIITISVFLYFFINYLKKRYNTTPSTIGGTTRSTTPNTTRSTTPNTTRSTIGDTTRSTIGDTTRSTIADTTRSTIADTTRSTIGDTTKIPKKVTKKYLKYDNYNPNYIPNNLNLDNIMNRFYWNNNEYNRLTK